MKKFILFSGFILAIVFSANAQTPTKLKVSGNCGMCKSSIEKAAKTATKAAYDALHECCKYDRDSTQVAAIKKVTLVASGLTCSMCSKAIFKALSKLEFVEEVKVDIEKSMYILAFKTGKKVEIDQIKSAVTDAGFGVQSLVYE